MSSELKSMRSSNASYDPAVLREASAEMQRESVEQWFRERFEDPAHRTPYESAEGGYIWIWGGPFNARHELFNEFGGIVPDVIIEELASSLEYECHEWAPVDASDDYDEGLFDAVIGNSAAAKTLAEDLEAIESLLEVDVSQGKLRDTYNRLLFANAIAALEAFLSDTFINRVINNNTFLQAYVEFEPEFRERKIPLKDVLREAAKVTEKAKKVLLDTVWHNIAKVKPLYREVLHVDLGDVGELAKGIQTRHDIVHRNGRGKDGTVVQVEAAQIIELLFEIRRLAESVEVQVRPIQPPRDENEYDLTDCL